MNGHPYISCFFCVCDPHSRGEDLVTYTSPELLADWLTITGQADTIIPFNSHATNLAPPPLPSFSYQLIWWKTPVLTSTIRYLISNGVSTEKRTSYPPMYASNSGLLEKNATKAQVRGGEGVLSSLRRGGGASIRTDKVNVNVNAISVVTFVCVWVWVCVSEIWVMSYELWVMSYGLWASLPSLPCFLFVHTYVIWVLGCYSAPLAPLPRFVYVWLCCTLI